MRTLQFIPEILTLPCASAWDDLQRVVLKVKGGQEEIWRTYACTHTHTHLHSCTYMHMHAHACIHEYAHTTQSIHSTTKYRIKVKLYTPLYTWLATAPLTVISPNCKSPNCTWLCELIASYGISNAMGPSLTLNNSVYKSTTWIDLKIMLNEISWI